MPNKIQQENRSGTFPVRWPVGHRDDRPTRLIEITDHGAGEVFDALSSDTARSLLSHLHTDPQTASDLAEQVGTSVQNVQYHLQKFTDAGLVGVIDRWYSARGTEMKVYSPTDRTLVIYAGTSPNTKPFRELLSQVVGAIVTIGVVSAGINYLIRALAQLRNRGADAGGGDGGGGRVPPEPDPSIVEILSMDVSVGMIFFVGGLFVLALGVVRWYWWR